MSLLSVRTWLKCSMAFCCAVEPSPLTVCSLPPPPHAVTSVSAAIADTDARAPFRLIFTAGVAFPFAFPAPTGVGSGVSEWKAMGAWWTDPLQKMNDR